MIFSIGSIPERKWYSREGRGHVQAVRAPNLRQGGSEDGKGIYD